MRKKRKRHSAEEKAVILRRHLVDRVSVSDLCEEYGIHPTIFYRWRKAMFEDFPAVSEKVQDSEIAALKSQNERLQEKLAGKDRVIARIVSGNGPQFIARELKEFVRFWGMTQVRTWPCHPQTHGKIARFHQSLKRECIRKKALAWLDDARRVAGEFVNEYNKKRLHGGIGYVTPRDKLEGRTPAIPRERKRKLKGAQRRRNENYEKERTAALRGLDREKALVETGFNR